MFWLYIYIYINDYILNKSILDIGVCKQLDLLYIYLRFPFDPLLMTVRLRLFGNSLGTLGGEYFREPFYTLSIADADRIMLVCIAIDPTLD